MGRYYGFDAISLAPAGRVTGKLIMYDRGIGLSKWEEMLRDHELTPKGVQKAVEITLGDSELAETMRAHAEMVEMRRENQ